MPQLRAMVQKSTEKEDKQQHINGPENILLNANSTERIRNYYQKSLNRLVSSAAWNSLSSGKFLAGRVTSNSATVQLHTFEILKNPLQRH